MSLKDSAFKINLKSKSLNEVLNNITRRWIAFVTEQIQNIGNTKYSQKTASAFIFAKSSCNIGLQDNKLRTILEPK